MVAAAVVCCAGPGSVFIDGVEHQYGLAELLSDVCSLGPHLGSRMSQIARHHSPGRGKGHVQRGRVGGSRRYAIRMIPFRAATYERVMCMRAPVGAVELDQRLCSIGAAGGRGESKGLLYKAGATFAAGATR